MSSPLISQPLPVLEVYVAQSEIHGYGLFAASDIPESAFIGFYEGEETTEDGAHVLWVQQDEEDDWLGYDGTNQLRFLNHSRLPNCEMDGQHLYACREILAHEELTIDYGDCFDEETMSEPQIENP